MDFATVFRKLGYYFRNTDLLERALRHRSLGKKSNERLEFLGDAILDFIVAEELFRRYPDTKEGDLSRMRASLVNGEVLAELADKLGLWSELKFGNGEVTTQGHKSRYILADAMEAIIGAIYLDSGFLVTQRHVLGWLSERLDNLAGTIQKDPKSLLQETLQRQKLPLPLYEIVEESGADHLKNFKVSCKVEGISDLTYGTAYSRRAAEQAAAEAMLAKLDVDHV